MGLQKAGSKWNEDAEVLPVQTGEKGGEPGSI
jgi:hypothetical protein